MSGPRMMSRCCAMLLKQYSILVVAPDTCRSLANLSRSHCAYSGLIKVSLPPKIARIGGPFGSIAGRSSIQRAFQVAASPAGGGGSPTCVAGHVGANGLAAQL